MMRNSSNIDMEEVFEQLANIKMVDPNANLYRLTLNRIKKQNIISLFWVKTIACSFIVFIATAFYFSPYEDMTSNKELSGLIYETNNLLYHE